MDQSPAPYSDHGKRAQSDKKRVLGNDEQERSGSRQETLPKNPQNYQNPPGDLVSDTNISALVAQHPSIANNPALAEGMKTAKPVVYRIAPLTPRNLYQLQDLLAESNPMKRWISQSVKEDPWSCLGVTAGREDAQKSVPEKEEAATRSQGKNSAGTTGLDKGHRADQRHPGGSLLSQGCLQE